jgi:hypothetical protein
MTIKPNNMNHYSREELINSILNYCGEETNNIDDVLALAVTKDDDLYRYVVNVSEVLNVSVAKFVKEYYSYEAYPLFTKSNPK